MSKTWKIHSACFAYFQSQKFPTYSFKRYDSLIRHLSQINRLSETRECCGPYDPQGIKGNKKKEIHSTERKIWLPIGVCMQVCAVFSYSILVHPMSIQINAKKIRNEKITNLTKWRGKNMQQRQRLRQY